MPGSDLFCADIPKQFKFQIKSSEWANTNGRYSARGKWQIVFMDEIEKQNKYCVLQTKTCYLNKISQTLLKAIFLVNLQIVLLY